MRSFLVRIHWDREHATSWALYQGQNQRDATNFARDLRILLNNPGEHKKYPHVEVITHIVTPDMLTMWATDHGKRNRRKNRG